MKQKVTTLANQKSGHAFVKHIIAEITQNNFDAK